MCTAVLLTCVRLAIATLSHVHLPVREDAHIVAVHAAHDVRRDASVYVSLGEKPATFCVKTKKSHCNFVLKFVKKKRDIIPYLVATPAKHLVKFIFVPNLLLLLLLSRLLATAG